MMRELYTQVIMDHYQRPRNWGVLEDADLEEHLLNPLCGDEVAVYAAFEGDKVANVRFSGRGCAISQASASMMTERLSGKRLKEAEAEIETFKEQMVGKKEFPELDDLAALKGVVKYPSRIKCAVLAWSAFHEGLSKGGRGSEEPTIPEQ
jgi:nitrogen fixation NifU-like protein